MSYERLKQRQRAERHTHNENLVLRTHRSLSWLNRAEQAEDLDGQFIFLWIAFNAAYATEIDERQRLSEQETFKLFLNKLCELDQQSTLEKLVWQAFPGNIRVLLDNPFVFQSFWDYQNGKLSHEEWQQRFIAGKQRAKTALGSRDTATVLAVVFSRLYTLRNQLIHGGATWNGQVNREQLRDCVAILGQLVPLVIEIMLDNPNTLWGDACYPVVKD
ncbi:HEPN domain-containing protein [Halopseudomonas aestusnigri]|uniref:HEPN domain-containing protein n=1 Tax=Halopseudomonas aestusnigri TaxID=857252 RepID=UPI002556F8A8|nr:HEPN domain-containing protein [Halopseudomonas aestusnigri]MDL2198138.1 HEPN domain-containing protein [Halopseudomonas aestusnigri]